MGHAVNNKLNIGIVCHPAYGGSGVVASELGLALARRGHKIHFISHALPFRLRSEHENFVFHQVEVTNYPLFKYPPYSIALAGRLVALCKEAKFDVIHVHYAIPHAIAAYLCRQVLRDNCPAIITTLHGTDITLLGIDETLHEITEFAINSSDAITAVSHSLAQSTRSTFHVREPIHVIPNFINPETLSPDLRDPALRAQYAPSGEMLVGHMSNMRPVKRVLDVIRAFHLLQKQVPARLLMIGEGPELQPARKLAADLGVAEQIEFAGNFDHVGRMLAVLDLFLLTSDYESFGLAALEAMACGVPVICYNVGGLPEVVKHGVSGFLVDPGDYQSMARAAVPLLQDGDRLRAMSEQSRKRAVEQYPEDKVIDMYEALYRRSIHRAGAGDYWLELSAPN